jgi:MoaA/NifB/PqqE/SkfB family radical SAM enzyme
MMIFVFDKKFKNEKYEILFNSKTGVEVMRGINGNDDPFSLNMASLLDVGVMGTCKHKCVFCYQGHIDRPNMTLENFKKIIDETSYHVNQIALGGRGDPNHHEDFEGILSYCKDNNVVPNYTTSGIGLTDEQIALSKKYCGAVAVSDYEADYTYDAISRLIEAGVTTNIHQIFSSKTFEKCINIVKGNDVWNGKVDRKKLFAVIFLLFKPQGAGSKLKFETPTDAQLRTFSQYIFDDKNDFSVGMDSCLVNHISKHVEMNALQKMSLDTCEAARMSGYISPSMNMMPCSFADEKKFSRHIENGWCIHDIWKDSFPFKAFRKTLETNPNQCPLNL